LNTYRIWYLEKEILHWIMLVAGRNSQTAAFWIFPMSRGRESNAASVLQSTCGRPEGHLLPGSTQVGGYATDRHGSVIKVCHWLVWFNLQNVRPSGVVQSSRCATEWCGSVIKVCHWVVWFSHQGVRLFGMVYSLPRILNTAYYSSEHLNVAHMWEISCEKLLCVKNCNCGVHMGVMVAAERVSETLGLYSKLIQLVVWEDFPSLVVAAKGSSLIFCCRLCTWELQKRMGDPKSVVTCSCAALQNSF
jgi:hypothetical protein